MDIDLKQRPYKILIVEDDASDRILTANKIKLLWPNCKLVEAKSMREAYAACKVHSFDMVMLDLNLPDGFGPNSVHEMRRFNRNVPIVVMTGILTSITSEQALKLGANHVISKSEIMEDSFQNVLKQSLNP